MIHEELRKETERCTCAHRFPITHISTSDNKVQYGFGFGSTMKRMVRILRSTVMVRVGGGWEKLDEFLVKHDPCRAAVSYIRFFFYFSINIFHNFRVVSMYTSTILPRMLKIKCTNLLLGLVAPNSGTSSLTLMEIPPDRLVKFGRKPKKVYQCLRNPITRKQLLLAKVQLRVIHLVDHQMSILEVQIYIIFNYPCLKHCF